MGEELQPKSDDIIDVLKLNLSKSDEIYFIVFGFMLLAGIVSSLS